MRTWYDGTAAAIVESLSADPATEAWTFTRLAPRNIGFWRRRRAQETLMHLWDGQEALGTTEPFEADLAADGVSEVFEMFAQRMVDRGLATQPEAAITVRATDTGQSWTFGPGEPIAEVAGSASDLLLLLWQRKASADPEFSWQGDRAAGEGVIAGPLTP